MERNIQSPCMPESINSWYDLQKLCPTDPLELLANAEISGTAGSHYFSGNYIEGAGSWADCTATISAKPVVSALETNNEQMVADADQWNFSHQTWLDSASLAIPLRKKIFLRGGIQWVNLVEFSSGGDPITEIQLSFLDNAATRGDKQASVPVIRWTGLNLTDIPLSLTFKMYGEVVLGLWLYNGTNYQMFEIDITIIG